MFIFCILLFDFETRNIFYIHKKYVSFLKAVLNNYVPHFSEVLKSKPSKSFHFILSVIQIGSLNINKHYQIE